MGSATLARKYTAAASLRLASTKEPCGRSVRCAGECFVVVPRRRWQARSARARAKGEQKKGKRGSVSPAGSLLANVNEVDDCIALERERARAVVAKRTAIYTIEADGYTSPLYAICIIHTLAIYNAPTPYSHYMQLYECASLDVQLGEDVCVCILRRALRAMAYK